MTPDRKIPGSDEAWDRRELGADPNFVAVADADDDGAIDAALELQPISIRLQKSLIEDFKMIGNQGRTTKIFVSAGAREEGATARAPCLTLRVPALGPNVGCWINRAATRTQLG